MMKAPAYANKRLHQMEVERRQKLHRERLATIKPTSQTNSCPVLDRHEPVSMRMKHMKFNPKKHKAEQERLEAIQRENKKLLERMYNIMRQSVGGEAMEYTPGVRINRHQVPITDSYVSSSTNMRGAALPLESVNFERRKREQEKIMRENQAILARITHRKSQYDHKRWAAERTKNEEYMTRMRKDDTAGYLPQGKDGHSLYYRPQTLSMSTARLPSLGTAGSGTTDEFGTFLATGGSKGDMPSLRARTAGGTGGRRRRKGKKKGLSNTTGGSGSRTLTPYEAPVSPIQSRPGSGASRGSRGSHVSGGAGASASASAAGSRPTSGGATKPSADWYETEQAKKLLSATVALRLATVSRTTPSGSVVGLVVDEVPHPEHDTTSITGLSVRVDGSNVGSRLDLAATDIVALVEASSAADDVKAAVKDAVAKSPTPDLFPSLAGSLSSDHRHAIGVVISHRVGIESEDPLELKWLDEAETHGEA